MTPTTTYGLRTLISQRRSLMMNLMTNSRQPQELSIFEDIPPLVFNPFSESGDEEEIGDEDEWIFPQLPNELTDEKYPRVNPGTIGEVGSIGLLAQASFSLKPMIEESVIPAENVFKSTYSLLEEADVLHHSLD